MEVNKVQWKVGGAAGQGVKSSGLIFAKTCTRAGLWAFGYTEYPSLIKGLIKINHPEAIYYSLYSGHIKTDIPYLLNYALFTDKHLQEKRRPQAGRLH